MPPARALAIAAAALAIACAGTPPAESNLRPPPVDGRYARVEIAFTPGGDSRLAPAASARLLTVAGQSARDWLEHGDRLAVDGAYSLAVSIDSARLRSAWTAWLFAWAAAPDHVAARVAILRHGTRVGEFAVRVESALSGYSWRDRDARLDRLARRLGHRVAQGL